VSLAANRATTNGGRSCSLGVRTTGGIIIDRKGTAGGAPPRAALDPDEAEMRRLGSLAVERIVEHLATLGEQRVAARGSAEDFARLVDEPVPETGRGAEDCLRFFFERIVPRMTRVNHPRFHAYIPCPSSFAGLLGEILAAGTNPFVGSWLGGATLSSLELTVLRWIAALVGYPEDAAGILTSGGSVANLIALAAARARSGGLPLPQARIYVSTEGHASMTKAARLLGFPRESIRTVAVDSRLRLDAGALREALRADRRSGGTPLFACANAGTTNTGAVDPLEEVAAVCRESDVWFHVDGAYGGFAALTPYGRDLLRGMERADSLTLDPHKWLYAPMGTGCALVRDASSLEAAFATEGHYLRDLPRDEVNFLARGPELSRPARVIAVWMVLRSAGREALAAQIEEDLRLARLAAALLEEDARFEIVDPPQLSVVAFRHRPREGEAEPERSARDGRLMEATLADGTLMLSSTEIDGRNALRLAVMNHRTTEADVRRSVARIRELAE
jgi:glutamate/tyrosine decarboxylase-like PLP-dependent enzyme